MLPVEASLNCTARGIGPVVGVALKSATGVGAEDPLADGLPDSPVPPPPLLHPSTPRRTSIFTATSSDKSDRYMFISQERAGQRRLRQQGSPDRYRRFYQPDRPARRCTAPRPATSGGCWGDSTGAAPIGTISSIVSCNSQHQLTTVESLGITAGRIAFHAAQPHEGEQGLLREPALAVLGLKGIHNVTCFLLVHLWRERH